jgi:enterochelin esterase-like enzyme
MRQRRRRALATQRAVEAQLAVWAAPVARLGRFAWSSQILRTLVLGLLADVALQGLLAPGLSKWLVDLSFDLDRAVLLAGVLLALPAALLAALPWRQRAAAIGGAIAGFALAVALPFAQHAVLPAHDVLGAPLRLDPSALAHALLALFCLAALLAALGAGLGGELGDWLAPLPAQVRVLGVALARAAWPAPAHRCIQRPAGKPALPTRSLFVAGAVLIALAVGVWQVREVSALFFYGPEAVLQPPASIATRSPSHVLPGQVLTITYTSAIFHGAPRSFDVYLPPDYAAPAAAGQRYAVVYLLHGSPGTPYGMLHLLLTADVLDRLIETQQIRPLIAVAPDGNSTEPYPSEWTNSANGRERVEDALLDEVIPYVDIHFRTIATASGRVVAGLSTGGYGATNLAVKHPDVFSGVIAMGAYFVPEAAALRGNASLIAANTPALVLQSHPAAAADLRFFLAAGTDDEPYTSYTRTFAQQLAALGLTYTLQVSPGGHAWQLWEEQIVAGLRWFFGLRRASPRCVDCGA